jgi:hypothetical protein
MNNNISQTNANRELEVHSSLLNAGWLNCRHSRLLFCCQFVVEVGRTGGEGRKLIRTHVPAHYAHARAML